jgi:L-iditol 2-dehydrogenase
MTASKAQREHKAAVLYGAKDLRIEAVETPNLKNHEIQVIPRATGICGTDLHYYQNGRNGIYTVTEPLILGHEAAGEVVAVGSDVVDIKVGDRVAIEPQLACLSCTQCRSGCYNLCPKMRFTGSASAKPPAQGSLQQLWNHPASLAYKLPDSVSYAEGAMVEPLSVAIHSVRKAGVRAGQTVLVTGAGAVGLLCAKIAKISGASRVIITDVEETRLDFAMRHKLADAVYKMPLSARAEESPSDFAARVSKEITNSGQKSTPAHVAFECSGVETCLNVCIGSAGPGGKVVIVGMGRPMMNLNVGVTIVREVEILGVWRYTNTFQPAIDLIEAGVVDVKPLVTHQFDFTDVVKALELALTKPADFVKCVLTS